MTAKQLIAVLKDVDPKAPVFANVKASNKSVQGVQIIMDPKGKTTVLLK